MFFEKIKDRSARTVAVGSFVYWFFALLYLETLLHAVVYGGFSGKFAYAVGFTAAAACVMTVLISFIPKKANFGVSLAVTLVMAVLYGSQMVYNFVFGTMYSVALMQQGGAAITSFWKEMLMTMWEELPSLLLLFVPVAVLILLRKFRGGVLAASNAVYRIILVVLAAAVFAATAASLRIGGTGPFTDYDFYHSDTIATQQTVERFGLLTAFRLELFGSGGGEAEKMSYYVPVEETEPPATEAEDAPEAEETTEATEPPVEYNVLDIDFTALNELTEDKKIRAINDYCAQLTGTNKNEYTGMLKDYNLIVLCGESFSAAAIHPDVTPTLYRLANEGIIFNNYYNTFPNTTTDGEYALCLGLFPDTSRSRASSSLYASRNSYLPFALGNVFADQAGIQSYGYHNYNGRYYGREESHPNMGYTMKFAGDGMTFTTNWPASDLEMMEQSVDDYIGQEQFHAYYMTFSGHYKYDITINSMASRNWDAVKDLDYSSAARAYLSCNIELDKALEYLMQRLEEEGIADRTAIVLAGDHFPYGLTDKQFSELVGHEVDALSKFKDTLIFWVGGLEENIIVDEYCCNVDILPTSLNLWGLEYDSRLLAGTDVFSDGTHMAVLINKSFLTDKVWFRAGNGNTQYLVEESELPENYLENMIKLVDTKFSISSDILNTAYYNFVFDKGEVKVKYENWNK